MSSPRDSSSRKRKRRGKVPDNERIRKAVACVECKRQKLKCIGAHPCDRCSAKGISCKQESQVRVNEDLLYTSLQRLSYMEAIIKTSFPGIETSLEQLKEKLAELTGDVRAKEMIMDINLRNIQQLDSSDNHTFYEDVGSTSSFVVRAREIVSQGTSKTKPPSTQHESNLYGAKMGNITSEASRTSSDLLEAALFCLPSYDEATRLIDIFISVAKNNTFFYLDSKSLRAIVRRIYQERSALGLNDINHVCLLYMALCMGCIFSHVWKDRTSPVGQEDEENFPGSNFYEHSQLLLPAVINDSSVETVQVFFLASMYVLASQEMEMAYTYLGIAMRAAVANGMHKNFSLKNDSNNKVAESRKRLFWSVYTIERRTAIALGRPETLPLSEIELDLPVYCNALDNSENASITCMILIITISLLTIKIHDMWFRGVEQGLKFATIMDLYHSIDQWRKQIPPHLDANAMNIEDPSYRGAVHIQFACNLAQITLGRPFLLLKLRDTNVSGGLDESVSSFATQMVLYSYNAASEIVEILVKLKANKLLSYYSCNDYTACHGASFVLVIYLALYPSTEALQRLNEAVSILQQISYSCKYTQKSTDVILNLRNTVQQGQTYQHWIHRGVLGIGESPNPDIPLDVKTNTESHRQPQYETWGKLDASLDALTEEDWFPSVLSDGTFPLDPDNSIAYLFRDTRT